MSDEALQGSWGPSTRNLSDRPDLTRGETAEEEQAALAALAESFEMVTALSARLEGWVLQAGTSLAGDDAALPYEPLSHQLRTAWGVALDNLQTVRLVVESGQVPMLAHFGLLRNAIEAVGLALWTLGPTSRDERVRRALSWTLEDRKDIYSLEATMQGRAGEGTELPEDDGVRKRLCQIRDARPAIAGRTLKVPSITERLTQAQEYADNFPYPIIVAWKMLSGFAHGRRSTLLAILDREVLGRDDQGVEIRMTSNIGVIAGFYKIVVHYLMRLLVNVSARNGDPLGV